jgi:hypothetical protein
MERLGTDSGEREALYLRICRLDPLQAIDFRGREGSSGDESDGGS